MEGDTPTIEWYLARDGQQHGPLTDAEMRKFVELGHLRETDLVWRAGFDDWWPSTAIFPPRTAETAPAPGPVAPAPAAAPARPVREPGPARLAVNPEPARAQPQPRAWTGPRDRVTSPGGGRELRPGPGPGPERREQPDFYATDLGSDLDDQAPQGSGSRKAAVRAVAILLVLVALAAGTWLVWDNRDRLGLASLGGMVATASNTTSEAAFRVSPFGVTGSEAAAIGSSMQRSAVWQVVKREFPEWYGDKVAQVAKVVADSGDERAVARVLAEVLVSLRREHAAAALTAPLPALRKVASTFIDNLVELSKLGPDQCFGFISFGEGTPFIVELSKTPQHAEHVQRQMVAVFEAVGEGRRAQFAPQQARRADYDMLSWELAKRNWTREDMLTFSDPKRLAALPAESVCKMVQDWFSAQLDVIDDEVQHRLLSNSLKPLVYG